MIRTRQQLGIIPLVWGAAVLAGTAGAGLGWWNYTKSEDYDRYKEQLKPPKPGPAPTAPQTKGQMTDPSQWTPDILAAEDRLLWEYWRQNAIPDTPDMEREKDKDNTKLLIAAGLGVAAVVMFTR